MWGSLGLNKAILSMMMGSLLDAPAYERTYTELDAQNKANSERVGMQPRQWHTLMPMTDLYDRQEHTFLGGHHKWSGTSERGQLEIIEELSK